MKPFQIMFAIAVLCALLSLIFVGGVVKIRRPHVNRDPTTLRNLEIAIKLYECDVGSLPVTHSGPTSLQDNGGVVGALLSETTPDGPYLELRDEVVAGLVVDTKGNPFHFALDADGDGEVEINGKVIPQRIAIWSYGENGKNEFGEGDDLRTW